MRISDWSSDVCSSDLKIRIANLAKPDLSKLSENLSFPNLEHTIAIVKDRRLYDLVNNGIYPADKVRREVAITVFFRFTANGISALAVQMHDNEINLLDWCCLPRGDETALLNEMSIQEQHQDRKSTRLNSSH